MNYETMNRVLEHVSGASFIGIDTVTNVALKGGKKNPFQGRVTKSSVGNNVIIFQNKEQNGYVNMVKRRLLEEGKDPENFSVGERKWGTRIPNSPFIEHKAQYYLEVIYLKSGNVEYLVDGVVTDPSEIEGLEVEKKVDEESQGGLENKVILRTITVENITRIAVDGKEFK